MASPRRVSLEAEANSPLGEDLLAFFTLHCSFHYTYIVIRPGAYPLPGSMGKQVLSVFPAVPTPVFTNSKREASGFHSLDGRSAEYAPPPGACEPQVDSRKRTCGSIKFGKGYRKGPGLQKETLAEPSPGPGSYVIPGGISTIARGTPFRSSPAISLSGREKFGSPW